MEKVEQIEEELEALRQNRMWLNQLIEQSGLHRPIWKERMHAVVTQLKEIELNLKELLHEEV